MGKEIEKKFLLKNELWRLSVKNGVNFIQGYLSCNKDRTVRVRVVEKNGFLTIKGRAFNGIREEYEYEIPVEDAKAMIETLCIKPVIKKKRYKIDYKGLNWEVDEFFGENKGLILAEIELESIDQVFKKPDWIGREVTKEPKYYNSNLVDHSYINWKRS